jgi:chromosome segregation ATPase
MSFTDQEVIRLMHTDPRIMQAAAEVQAKREKAELDARIAAIEEVNAAVNEGARLEKEIHALNPKFDTAKRDYEAIAAKMGELHRRREQAQRNEGHACERLGAHGEGQLVETLSRLDMGLRSMRAEAQLMQDQVARQKFDVFAGGYPPSRARDMARLKEHTGKIKTAEQIMAQLYELRGARISPRELAAEIENLMSPLVEPNE